MLKPSQSPSAPVSRTFSKTSLRLFVLTFTESLFCVRHYFRHCAQRNEQNERGENYPHETDI